MFLPYISFIIAFRALEYIKRYMCRVYIAGQIYPDLHPYGSNWGHKIADFVFFLYISFIIAFTALEYIKVLANHMWRVYLADQTYPLNTPPPHPMGQTGVTKIVDLVPLPCISFIIAFTALEWIPYMETPYSQSV